MALRETFRPLRPDLDNFLFAPVGVEQDGVPLSVISALTRLGRDPWDEASRLSSLGKREAVEQLARLIMELPGSARPLAEARQIAGGLVACLPRHAGDRPSATRPVRRRFRWPTMPRQSQFLMLCVVVAVAAIISILLHGGFPFGGSP